jgi:energy-converting hydrogenase Eha subunit B
MTQTTENPYTSQPPPSSGTTQPARPGGPIGGVGELPHTGIVTFVDVLWLSAILIVVGLMVAVAARRARRADQ